MGGSGIAGGGIAGGGIAGDFAGGSGIAGDFAGGIAGGDFAGDFAGGIKHVPGGAPSCFTLPSQSAVARGASIVVSDAASGD